MGHAEAVPAAYLDRPHEEVFYLPMHAVVKESSTTMSVRAVFDASEKSSSGVSLNDQPSGCVAVLSSPPDSPYNRHEPYVPCHPAPCR